MKNLSLIILVILLICFISKIQAQTRVGFFIGPNYSSYKVSWISSKGQPGLGFQGGISLKSKTSKLTSFRCDLSYSILTTDAVIELDAGENDYNTKKIDAQYLFHSIHLNPQLQFNFLKNRSLFSSIGIGPRTITASGKGVATSSSNHTSEFKGGKYNFIFHPVILCASVFVGYQNLKLGPLNGFIEAGVRGDIMSFTNNTVHTASWRAITMSMNIGVFIGATNKPLSDQAAAVDMQMKTK